MMRHLTILVLSGVLGTLVLAGHAEAGHWKKCAPPRSAPAPVCIPAPVACKPVHCARVVRVCAPKVNKCCSGGLFAGLFHRNRCAPAVCATPVCYAYTYPMVVPSGQQVVTPQSPAPR